MVVNFFWVGLGGALGSIARYGMGMAVARQLGETFPWGTLFINIIGSFVIAFFGALTFPQGRYAVPPEARLFVMVGVCGGFTTFSSFSLQTVDLLRGGEPLPALGYVVASVVLCLLAATVGYYAAGAVIGRSPI